jgi:NADP-dependent 3-hydroxy acid dehydrogenase YdfG
VAVITGANAGIGMAINCASLPTWLHEVINQYVV